MAPPVPRLDSFAVGGVKLSCCDCAQAVEQFFALITQKAGGFVTVTGAHGIVESQTDDRLREIINSARMALPDGMPVKWLGRLKGAAIERVSGANFFGQVLGDSRAKGIRHYFYGSRSEVMSPLIARAASWVGADAIAGSYCPPIRPVGALEHAGVITQIAARQPEVLWVGLSTPKQEYWMADHANAFPGTLLVGVGAAFEFLAGTKTRAPPLIQHVGLEWLFRLAQEPKRLWPRYRRLIPAMLKIMIKEACFR